MYFVVHVKDWPRELEEWLIERAFDRGCAGMSEKLDFVQLDYEAAAEERVSDPYNLEIYFTTPVPSYFNEELLAKSNQASVVITSEDEKDWIEEWKKGYEPFEIVKDIFIVPRWREAPENAEKIILLEPGMAFGTGTHETTQLTAQLIPRISDQTALDVGTGTGILAMICERLGYKNIVAIDSDQEAVRVARENIAINSTEQITVPELSLKQVQGQFDVVIANIVDHVLIKIVDDLFERLNPKGYVVLGGIMIEHLDDVLKALPQSNLKVEQRIGKEWCSLLCQLT